MFGIYCIENRINHTVYIGSTVQSFEKRFSSHKSLLRRNKHINTHLQNAWNKYNEVNFEFKIIQILENKSIVIDAEQKWIDHYLREGYTLYNLRLRAASCLGYKWNEESKSRLSKAMKGRKQTEHHIKLRINRTKETLGKRMIQHALAMSELRKKDYGFVTSPDHIDHHIFGLDTFCKKHSLSSTQMRRLINNERTSYKGWVKKG